jgi:cytochrome c-type biogenesis protein CcmH
MKNWWLISLWFCSALVMAGVEVHEFKTPEQEQQYNRMIDELRCLVCQNQNLADSNAELAQDLRQEVYDMIQQGASDQEIIDFMVARYGDFVLYRPPLKSTTLILWIGPFVILGIGVLVLLFHIRKRRAALEPVVDEAELEKARQLLNKDRNPS